MGSRKAVRKSGIRSEPKYDPLATFRSCQLCGKRQERDRFKEHVRRKHMRERPFRCQMCPANARGGQFSYPNMLKRHLADVHGVKELTEQNFTGSVPWDVLDDLVRQCFGDDANSVPYR